MRLRPNQVALVRILVIPVIVIIIVGWEGYLERRAWGEYVIGIGVFAFLNLLPYLWKRKVKS
jgi:hypothetical protein